MIPALVRHTYSSQVLHDSFGIVSLKPETTTLNGTFRFSRKICALLGLADASTTHFEAKYDCNIADAAVSHNRAAAHSKDAKIPEMIAI